MKLGTNDIGSVYLGTNAVQSVYLGTNLVWTSFTPDSDAQAFFDRVTTAGGSLSNTEKLAVNQLVIDMKDDGIWTKMKAIYPMVGASAAACAQNLKSSSFTGTFNGGWTFLSTGVTPNGTSAFMNTNLNASTDIINSNFHLSFYSRTNNTDNAFSNEIYINKTYAPNGWVALRLCNKSGGGFAGTTFGNDSTEGAFASSTTAGYMISSETSSSLRKVFKNNSILATNTNNSTTAISNANFTIGGYVDGYSNNECALLSIGDGLTDTQASNFYTAVQAFQTTLNRQV